MELCLGTVQFGMDYGIKKQKKPELEQSIEVLDYATQNGISTIDTANAYGNAEEVVGTFIKRKTIDRNKISVISKVRPNILDEVKEEDYFSAIKNNFEETVKCLNTDYLDGYMFHSARYVFDENMLEALKKMKTEGYIKKFGVSIYEPIEAKEGLEIANLDLMQMPFSIFDQRMKKEGIFDLAKDKRTEIHTRSAFIQGLMLMSENEIPEYLQKARPIITKIDKICEEYKIKRVHLALQYVKQESTISKLVFGVDNLEQLKENLNYFNEDIGSQYFNEIEKEFNDISADIVMPSLWIKK